MSRETQKRTMGRWARWPQAGALVVVLLACAKAKPPPPQAVPVTTALAERRDVPLVVKAIGNVEAFNTVAIKSQVSGQISDVFFEEGQEVRAGDRLFLIDPRPFEATLRQAQAAVLRGRAQAANAKADADRYADLAGKGVASPQEYESARTNAESLAAVVKADQAALENARLQLAYTLIRSPIAGRTGAIQIKKGNVVKANDLPLVTINQLVPINVSFAVPEQELAAIQKHRAKGELGVAAVLPDDSATASAGSLTFIDNGVNTSTGTILLKATFPNQGQALWPGQFVNVVLTLATEKDRTVVPSQAVQTGQQGPYVFVIKDDQSAELRAVTAAGTFEGWTVLDGGVKPGEQVVTDGQLRLVPGVKVEVKSSGGAPIESAKAAP